MIPSVANPYVVAIHQSMVQVNFLDPVTLSFRAAYNSDGTNNFLETITLEQIGNNQLQYTLQQDPDSENSQIFSITFDAVGGSSAGTYVACKSHYKRNVILELNLTIIIIIIFTVTSVLGSSASAVVSLNVTCK